MAEYPIAVVSWEDASNLGTWCDIDEAKAFARDWCAFDYHCTSVGFLIRDDDECVVLASRADGQFQQVGLVERIPRGMVRSVTLVCSSERPIDSGGA